MATSGKAAEFFVAAELSKRQWNVVHLGGNFRDADMCIEHKISGRVLWIQVKSTKPNQAFILKEPGVSRWVAADKWYVFVSLDEKRSPGSSPEHYFCIPSSDVQSHASTSHAKYMNNAGRDGNKRKGSDMRKFHIKPADQGRVHAFPEKSLKKADKNFDFSLLS